MNTTSIFNLLQETKPTNNNLDYYENINEMRNTSLYDDDLIRSSSIDYFGQINDSNILQNYLSNNKTLNLSSKNNFTAKDFEILSSLGSGAYAEVYKAKHKISGVIYAIKIIDKKKIDRENRTYQIFVENEMLNLCDNINIISIYGYYEDIDKFYLVEEYCKKGDLSKFLENNIHNLQLEEIKFITAQIVLSLEYLGSLKIIHRDVKPENIMIDSNFNLKLIDFGTSTFKGKILNEKTYHFIDENRFIKDPTFTESYNYLLDNNKINKDDNLKKENINEEKKVLINQNKKSFFINNKLKFESHIDQKNIEILKKQKFVGTVEYMPPEIINYNNNEPNNNKVGEYSDIWSMGITLFQLFTGQTPFNDKTDYLIFQNISQGKFDQSLLKDIDNDARDLILNILCVEPEKRLGYDERKGYDYNILKNHPFFLVDKTNDINEIRKSLLFKTKYLQSSNKQSEKTIFEIARFKFSENSKEHDLMSEKSKKTEDAYILSNSIYNNICGNILKKGILKKRSPYYYYDLRKVILFDTPRIDYYEPNGKEKRGSIQLSKKCIAELVKSNQFLLKTPNRIYSFMCKEKYDISPWVTVINNAIEKFADE